MMTLRLVSIEPSGPRRDDAHIGRLDLSRAVAGDRRQALAGGEIPVFGRHGEEIAHDRTGDAEMRVMGAFVAREFRGEALANISSAGEGEIVVDDDDLAVGGRFA